MLLISMTSKSEQKRKRLEYLYEESNLCSICGFKVDLDGKGDYAPSLEHKYPIGHPNRSSKRAPKQTSLAHKRCNNKLGIAVFMGRQAEHYAITGNIKY